MDWGWGLRFSGFGGFKSWGLLGLEFWGLGLGVGVFEVWGLGGFVRSLLLLVIFPFPPSPFKPLSSSVGIIEFFINASRAWFRGWLMQRLYSDSFLLSFLDERRSSKGNGSGRTGESEWSEYEIDLAQV